MEKELNIAAILKDKSEDTKLWSPKEVFDKVYKPCDDFKDRLKIEYNELNDRLWKLNTALQKDGFHEKVGDYQYQLLIQQKVGMGVYLSSLEKQIIDIDSGSFCKSPSVQIKD